MSALMQGQHLLSPALLPWLGLLYKLPALWRNPRSAALRALCFAFFALGTALVLLLPPVYGWIGATTGLPHLARLLAHSCGLFNGWAVQLLLLHLTRDGARAHRGARVRHVVLAVALAVMTALFLQAPIGSTSAAFLTTYADSPWIAAYLAVYLSYIGYSLFDIGSLSARYCGQARSGPLRVGLRLVAIGSLAGLVYPVEKSAYVVARLMAFDIPDFEAPLSTAVIAVSVLLVVTGLTLPSWGPQVTGAWECLLSHRLQRALTPLRAALVDAFPEIVIDPSPGGTQRQRLHRRVIEVRDGLLALRTFHEPTEAEASADPGRGDHRGERAPARRQAQTDAVAIHAALSRRQASQRLGGQCAIIAAPATVDLLADARQLAMVSQSFARLAGKNDRRRAGFADTKPPADPHRAPA